jgi:hypothetical protein
MLRRSGAARGLGVAVVVASVAVIGQPEVTADRCPISCPGHNRSGPSRQPGQGEPREAYLAKDQWQHAGLVQRDCAQRVV